MFSKAIVCLPSSNMANGLTASNLGRPDFTNALHQHGQYVTALEECGLDVTILDADDNYPDSVFIEDAALLTPHCAIITNPGAVSRKGEIEKMGTVLSQFFSSIEKINAPGTLEAGDVMMVGNHYYIGLSGRTNKDGAEQLIEILKRYGLSGSIIELENVLHLKTGVAYLENNNMVACGEFISHPDFKKYNIIAIDNDESYGANCIWINGNVLVAKGFPKTKELIEKAGYSTREVDVSEFRKLDGGLSCLSLRF